MSGFPGATAAFPVRLVLLLLLLLRALRSCAVSTPRGPPLFPRDGNMVVEEAISAGEESSQHVLKLRLFAPKLALARNSAIQIVIAGAW
jgi:hypothetical protein